MNIIISILACLLFLNVFNEVSSTYIPQNVKFSGELDIIDNNQNIMSTKNYPNDVDTMIINEEKQKTNIPRR